MTKSSLYSRIKWLAKKTVKFLFFAFLAYCFVLLLGLFPLNRDFDPAEKGVTIFVTSNAIHADLILPVSTETIDWRDDLAAADFSGDIKRASHVAFGWGDRGFYLETPTWNALKISTAANALMWPSATCMHVDFCRSEEYGDSACPVTISTKQYESLVEFIRNSFVREFDCVQQIEAYQYSTTDAFFEAEGNYHVLNTCNSWAGRGLATAGVKVPMLSPLPKTPLMYLPASEPSVTK